MTTINLTKQEASALIDKGFVAVVYVSYAYADRQAGDIVSRHKSSDAAQKAARKSTSHGVRYLDELI